MTPYAMLYTVAVGVPIAWAALALAAVLRRSGRPERGVWLAALGAALVVPALALLSPVRDAAIAPSSAPPIGPIGLPEFVVVPEPQSALDVSQLILLIWLFASGVLAIRWAVAAYRLSRASRLWAPGTIDGVSVWMTDDVGPAVSGVFRPRVLAPSWLHTLPGRERSLVLMHEQEHIRARDPLLVACARIARVLAPWNPVVWVLSWRLVRAVELDCDRRVLRRTSDVAAYGRTLFTVSRRRPGRLVAAAAFAESEAPLRSRILSMTTPPGTISVVALVSSTILGVVLLLGANQIPVPATGTGVQVVPEPDQTPTVTAFDAPPTPPPPPPPTRLVVRQSIGPNGEVVARVPSEPAWAPNGATLAPALEPPSAARELERVRQARERRLAPTPTPAPDPMAPAAVPPAGVEQVPEPAFTPMTIRPQLTNAPEVQQALMGEYPAALRDAGIGGAPVLWVHIGAGGSVDATRVAESSGFQALDEAAQRVASAMRFSPARNGDQVVPVWVQVPIRFAVVR